MFLIITILALCTYIEVVKRLKLKYVKTLVSIGEIISVILGLVLGSPWVPITTCISARIESIPFKVVFLIILLVVIPQRQEQVVLPDMTQYSTSIQELDQLLDDLQFGRE